MKKHKICSIATKAVTIKWFMLNNMRYLQQHDFDVHLLCRDGEEISSIDLGEMKMISREMKWGNVSVWEVCRQTYYMYKLFKREKYEIIQYAGFNASLYSAIAGWLARVPIRINCQWGISYPIYSGLQYYFRKYVTKLLCTLSTNVQPDSFSNLMFSIDNNLYPASKGNVIYNGSACGVDFKRFDISKRQVWKNEIRRKYSIPSDATILGYVGRIEPEKGCNELFEAFLELETNNVFLFIVGAEYGIKRMDQSIYARAKQDKRIIFTGQVDEVEKYHAFLDFLILPSWQEGFGLVVVEAAAVGTPAIVTDIKGPADIVEDSKTGYVCKVRNVGSLKSTMLKALNISKETYNNMSHEAFFMAKAKFDAVVFQQYFYEDRIRLLKEHQLI